MDLLSDHDVAEPLRPPYEVTNTAEFASVCREVERLCPPRGTKVQIRCGPGIFREKIEGFVHGDRIEIIGENLRGAFPVPSDFGISARHDMTGEEYLHALNHVDRPAGEALLRDRFPTVFECESGDAVALRGKKIGLLKNILLAGTDQERTVTAINTGSGTEGMGAGGYIKVHNVAAIGFGKFDKGARYGLAAFYTDAGGTIHVDTAGKALAAFCRSGCETGFAGVIQAPNGLISIGHSQDGARVNHGGEFYTPRSYFGNCFNAGFRSSNGAGGNYVAESTFADCFGSGIRAHEGARIKAQDSTIHNNRFAGVKLSHHCMIDLCATAGKTMLFSDNRIPIYVEGGHNSILLKQAEGGSIRFEGNGRPDLFVVPELGAVNVHSEGVVFSHNLPRPERDEWPDYAFGVLRLMALGKFSMMMVRLPSDMVEAIDGKVGTGTRSEFVRAALQHELKRRKETFG